MDPVELEKMLARVMGAQAARETMRMMERSGIDPDQLLSQLPEGISKSELEAGLVQFGTMLYVSSDGERNWEFMHQLARQGAATGGDPMISAARASEIRQALEAADLWLDPVVDLVSAPVRGHAWRRTQWVEASLAPLKDLFLPVALAAGNALRDMAIGEAGPEAGNNLFGEEDSGDSADVQGQMLSTMGATLFGAKIGHAAGLLARSVLGTHDTGIALGDPGEVAMIGANIDEFSEGLDIPSSQVLAFLATREMAYARLFGSKPWLAQAIHHDITRYANSLKIDFEAIERMVKDVDMSDPESIKKTFSNSMIITEKTPELTAILDSLETHLALAEGWVEHVTSLALAAHVPAADALREMISRRRASGGPAEAMFRDLVGLEIRPRRIREAVRLWEALYQRGVEARDALWGHPDVLPTSQELDHPEGFMSLREATSATQTDLDKALRDLLDGEES